MQLPPPKPSRSHFHHQDRNQSRNINTPDVLPSDAWVVEHTERATHPSMSTISRHHCLRKKHRPPSSSSEAPITNLSQKKSRKKNRTNFLMSPHSRLEQLRKRQSRRARHPAHAPLDHRPLHAGDRLRRERDAPCRVIRDELLGHRFWRMRCADVWTGEVVCSFFDNGDFVAVGRRSEFFCGVDGWYY